jgi:hypothetical protein
MLYSCIKRNLLLVPLHFIISRSIFADAHPSPQQISNKNAHCLRSPTCAPDRSRVVYCQKISPVPLEDFHCRYPLKRSYQYSLSKDCQSDSHCFLYFFLSATFSIFSNKECRLYCDILSVMHLREFSYLIGNPDLSERLDPSR